MMLISALLFGGISLAANYDNHGCYSSVNIASAKGTYMFQTPNYCLQECQGYKYFALKNGNECYCLSSVPGSSNLSSENCEIGCFGYKQESCGGSAAYEVYADNSTSTAIVSFDQGFSSKVPSSEFKSTRASEKTPTISPTSTLSSSSSSSYTNQEMSTTLTNNATAYFTTTNSAASATLITATSITVTSKTAISAIEGLSLSSSVLRNSSSLNKLTNIGANGGDVGRILSVFLIFITFFNI